MLSIAEIEPHIEEEFGSRLTPIGFKQFGKRKWIRSTKLPIREIFTIRAIRVRYYPVWGLSCGIVPTFRGQTFKPQATDKNAAMDLIIDPIDSTGKVPSVAFDFIPGYHTEIPIRAIQRCAQEFVPEALKDFECVQTMKQFCEFFRERSLLKYRRFTFDMYTAHQFTKGFVEILSGHKAEGIETIRQFCKRFKLDFRDKHLQECIRRAEIFEE